MCHLAHFQVESTDINSFEDHSKPASIGQEQIGDCS